MEQVQQQETKHGVYFANLEPNVLGPSTPAISRIRNQYIKNLVVKIPPKQSLDKTKNHILKVKSTFEAVKEFRSIRMIIDVDPY